MKTKEVCKSIWAFGACVASVLSAAAGDVVVSCATNATYDAALSGAGTFEKRGAGVLTVTSKNTAFTGDVLVSEGTLRIGATPSPFATNGTLTVASGAALDLGAPGAKGQAVQLGARKIVVSGAGPDGKGAIVNTDSASQYYALIRGELAGDATFGGGGTTNSDSAGRWDFRTRDGVAGTLTLNGHSIEKVGHNMVCLTDVEVKDVGAAKISVKEGVWGNEASTVYTGGAENLVDVYSGATLDFYKFSNSNVANPFPWSVNLQDGASIRFREGSAQQNRLTGPVTLAGGEVNVWAEKYKYGSLAGKVTGPGKLKSLSKSGGRVSLLNDANDYTGGTYAQGGDLYVASKGALPGYDDPSRVEIRDATLLLPYGTGAWGGDDVAALLNSGILRTHGSVVGLEVESGVATLAKEITEPLGTFSKYGNGRLDVTAPLTIANGALWLYDGEFRVDGTRVNVAQRNVYVRSNSSLVLTNGAEMVTQMTNSYYALRIGVAGSASTVSEVKVCAGSTLAADKDCTINKLTSSIQVGVEDGGRAVLTVEPGATVRHKILISGTDTSKHETQGAVIQNGGHVENQGGAGNDIRLGDYGYGYYELNDGDLEWWGYSTIGGNGDAKSRGVFVQHGGTFRYVKKHSAGRLGFSRGGSGVYYNDGGTLDMNDTSCWLAMGENNNANTTASASTFTLDGPNARATFGSNTHWFCNRPYHTATINLNDGGTFSCGPLISRDYYDKASEWSKLPSMKAYFNFDGGVFRAPKTMNLFQGTTNKMPTAVTVFSRGAVFDVTNATDTLTVNQPLRAPTGKGVSAIAAPSALLKKTGFIGSPYVTISGGGGDGATAMAVYDSKTRRVTGVKVTSAGFGYTSAPTVTVTGGGFTNVFTCTATIAENDRTGGLVKRGAGTLALTATNTFGGAISVEAGTLRVDLAEACPSNAVLHVANGATAQFSAAALARIAYATGGGTVAGGAVRQTGVWTIDATDIKDGQYLKVPNGSFDLSAVTGITFTNGGAMANGVGFTLAEAAQGITGDLKTLSAHLTGLPKGGWRLSLRKNGTQLRLSRSGLVFYIR